VLSLCLSRACLGKMSIFLRKWIKKTVFSYLFRNQTNPTAAAHIVHLVELVW
jgi:hypothetical protein